MKVAKFGGSSVANATQIRKVADIIKSDNERKFVVVSAPGKRNDEDIKVTDLLLDLAEACVNNDNCEKQINNIMSRFKEIITDLAIDEAILDDIETVIRKTIESEDEDFLKIEAFKSIGEDSSAKILSAYLNSIGIKSAYVNPQEAGVIVSNEPGEAQILEESYDKIYTLRERDGVLVIPGFFGYAKDGSLITFSRGGSDIT